MSVREYKITPRYYNFGLKNIRKTPIKKITIFNIDLDLQFSHFEKQFLFALIKVVQ